ncbi:hypothetical protein [Hymenobacter volaticus]|uniref:Glycosyltransferase RgtA/B/C/D-like domain-containing protein n=1 Tax=Hymenobacter volaticus TaxID=2932254 RepID=A0ABY4G5B0_9BACT|nr:hypothetical protein [Hymenobacter volaticus]UOQ66036.1 hypothetical protein MUN86_21395 [Hymenobacter volaticus]
MKSLACYLLIVSLSLAAVFQARKWETYDVLIWDMAGYYQYLSSYFIYDDIGDGSYTAAVRTQYRPDLDGRYALVPAPNGRNVIKYPLGMSLFYAPAFFLAHAIAKLAGLPADGYSLIYQKMIALGCLMYALVGLWILRKVLRHFFEDTTVALTLLAIGLATNFLNYATYESPTSHGTLFLLTSVLMLLTIRWLAAFHWHDAVLLGITLGIIGLVRITELWMVLVPALWGLTSRQAARERLWLLWNQRGQVVLIASLMLALLTLQLWFWHSVGGAWLIDSYPGEYFDFRHPNLLLGLFSARKGWLLYTPSMTLAIIGIFMMRRQVRALLPVLLVLLPLVLYITFSWENWWYGGGYSARTLVSIYPLLSLPMASFFDWSRRSDWLLRGVSFLLFLFIVLNLTQTWQYYRGILDCCDSNWDLYKERFFWLGWPSA